MVTGSRCVMRLGLPGCGKSLDQTENEVLEHLLAGTDVYCCYWINWAGPNYHYFPPTKQGWETIKDKRNCVVVFDEVGQVFDPRDWTEEGSEVRRWFQLHRHFHIDIYGNTQDVSLVAKSIGIVADEWQYIEKIHVGPLGQWIFGKLFGGERVVMQKSYLSWQQLKKMASGWEILQQDEERIDYDFERVAYNVNKIIHPELDEYKQEIIHTYCPQCAARQGFKTGNKIKIGEVFEEEIKNQILKDDTLTWAEFDLSEKKWKLKEDKFCPKHHEQLLEVRLSGLYDTDYEPPTEEVQIEFRAFSKQVVLKEYKGLLSPKQSQQKQGLIRRYNQPRTSPTGFNKAVDNLGDNLF